MKILIVEDEAIIAEDIREILVGMNHSVRWATNPEAAQRLATSGWPDLILMDVNLQRKGDGLNAARRILELWDIPVIFVTSTPMNEVFADPALLNCGYCGKPVDQEKLSSALQKTITRRMLLNLFFTPDRAGKIDY
jgi:CheY-like chemotaxis protein